MNTDSHLQDADLTRAIIGATYDAFNHLGFGYQEKYYQRAVAIELTKRKIPFHREQAQPLRYEGKIIGRYFADFVVHDRIVLELKVANAILEAYVKQVLGYLRACGLTVGILAVMTPDGVLIKRVVL